MHILVTNDDGPPSRQSSPYVHSLVIELQKAGHSVSVILPDTQRSWIGKAHIVGQPIKPSYYRPGNLHQDDGTTHSRPYNPTTTSNSNSLNGANSNGSSGDSHASDVEEWILIPSTPASCIQLGLHHFFQSRGPIDLVISGPNYGRNTTAVFALSSGTLGGALEAAVCGYKAIALSYAFFDRENKPELIQEASTFSVKLVERLAREQKFWDEGSGGLGGGRLYSVNVPLKEGVSARKVVWTEVLQNRWRGSSCFSEVEVPEEEDEGPEEVEGRVRRQEVEEEIGGQEVGEGNGGGEERQHVRHTHKHFKWAPVFRDVHESVEKSGPGNDGWAIREGYSSVTPLRANFMHVSGFEGELKL
ncbi:MAG: hypothetical protein M1820_001922 [Bogoriella megaspora]|nr:MAG: hypothetical protein M1820_001922 [Bogoriella megaspora]